MGFYLRKGFNFGPLRLNLSRSGLGASFGIKGARIGIGPRGGYVHVGRGGIYFRHSLGGRSTPSSQPAPGLSSPELLHVPETPADVVALGLTQVQRRAALFPIVLGAAIVVIVGLWSAQTGWYPWWRVALVASLPALLYARRLDVSRGTAGLAIDLDVEQERVFQAFVDRFRTLAGCSRVWTVHHEEETDQWKTHGKATRLTEGRLSPLPFRSRHA